MGLIDACWPLAAQHRTPGDVCCVTCEVLSCFEVHHQHAAFCLRSDLWFRLGAGGGARPVASHDPGGGDSVLQGAGGADGLPALRLGHRRLVSGLHLRGAAGTTHPLPGSEPHSAGESRSPDRNSTHSPAPADVRLHGPQQCGSVRSLLYHQGW